MEVRLTQIDGKLPNLALMKLAHHHRAQGHTLFFSRHVERGLFEPDYGRVYGSAIFSRSANRVERLRQEFPGAIVGGTWDVANPITVEDAVGQAEGEAADYSIYPGFAASIGFTQRGCRLKCGFCVVPKKEGRPRTVNTVQSIWRGAPYPKHLHLLDNDFFGQPREQWEARVAEIREGGYKVCLNQGINVRFIDDQSARALASIPLYDDAFKTPRLYTAWDNIGDEERFFRGVDILERNGVRPTKIMAYMLVGYDQRETWERVLYRLRKMQSRGIRPYVMPYNDVRDRTLPLGGCNERVAHRTLGELERWVNGKYYNFIPFEAYDASARGRGLVGQEEMAL